MTTVDAKGIIRYEASDSASPLHTALNLGLDSVSNALDTPGYLTRAGVHTVANLSGLNALRTQLNGAGYTGAVYAHRTDLGELWYHSGTGGSWGRYIPPVDDTGWITLTLLNGWVSSGANFTPQIRRVNNTVFLRGRVTSGTPGATIFTVAEEFRASFQQSWPVRQSSVTSDVTYLLYNPNGNFNAASTSVNGNTSVPNLYVSYSVG